jgi:hypothetical protein
VRLGSRRSVDRQAVDGDPAQLRTDALAALPADHDQDAGRQDQEREHNQRQAHERPGPMASQLPGRPRGQRPENIRLAGVASPAPALGGEFKAVTLARDVATRLGHNRLGGVDARMGAFHAPGERRRQHVRGFCGQVAVRT